MEPFSSGSRFEKKENFFIQSKKVEGINLPAHKVGV